MTLNNKHELDMMEANNEKVMIANKLEVTRKALLDCKSILKNLDDNYLDTIGEVIYKHSELMDGEFGPLTKMQEAIDNGLQNG